ncbi:hypothetical protein BDZ91DRAFT_837100 [Kalaharituber pfeilii]|nr:hypothetical protein BDZ91DRAFT_837100 [Kalaharituber pfeilii]
MDNTAPQHWGGAVPDAAGIYPSQYLLGRRFMMPFPGGSKNAVAVNKSQEVYIISLYTIIVTAIFAAWWILIATAIPYVCPKHLLAQTSGHMFTLWAINEPLQTAVLMLKYCWRLLASGLIKRSANNPSICPRSSSGRIANYLTFTWRDFALTLIFVFLAVGTSIGGVVAGILLPNKFILGHAAPANPYTVYYPIKMFKRREFENLRELYSSYQDHAGGSAFRALGTADSGRSRELLNTAVKFEKIPSQPTTDRGNEDSYTMEYVISVTGYDMGLQHAPDLSVELQGECKFMYEWDVNIRNRDVAETNEIELVEWALWPSDDIYENTTVQSAYRISFPEVLVKNPERRGRTEDQPHTYQFAMVPLLWGVITVGRGMDPWYHEYGRNSIRPGPPVLQCWERQTWSYLGWTGFIYFGASPLTKLAAMTSPLTLASVRTMGNLQRLVHGAYIMTRDLFRSTALDYGLWMDSPAFTVDVKSNTSFNALRMEDEKPLPGAGDFVIYTDQVTAFRLETLVAVPAVLVFSWLLVLLCHWLVRRKDIKKPTDFGRDTSFIEKGGAVHRIVVTV